MCNQRGVLRYTVGGQRSNPAVPEGILSTAVGSHPTEEVHSSKDALKQQIDSNLVLMRQLYLLRSIGISRNEEQRCMQCSNPQCSLSRMDLEWLPTIVPYLPVSEYTCNPTFEN